MVALELKIYPHREGTIHGIRTLVVQSDRGVHGVAVDHGRQTRIGGESERIVHTAREAQATNGARAQGDVPAQGDIIDIHIVAFLQPVVGDVLVFDVLRRRLAHHVIVGETRHVHIGQCGRVEYLMAESPVDLHREIEVFVAQRDVRTQHHLRCGLACHIAVAAVLNIDASVSVEIGNAVATTTVGLLFQAGIFLVNKKTPNGCPTIW